MPVEISTTDPDVKDALREIAEADSENITCLTLKPMEGQEIISLIIENFDKISLGSSALIAVLKTKINSIRISKDGVELSSSEKNKFLGYARRGS